MIEFNYEIDFKLKEKERLEKWILKIIESKGFSLGK